MKYQVYRVLTTIDFRDLDNISFKNMGLSSLNIFAMLYKNNETEQSPDFEYYLHSIYEGGFYKSTRQSENCAVLHLRTQENKLLDGYPYSHSSR